MSETAQTLIEAALRVIGVLASGESASTNELSDGLKSLRFMLRGMSARNLSLYYTTQDTVTLNGATSYTIGSSGTVNTPRPASIRGAYATSNNVDRPLKIIDEGRYRILSLKQLSGTVEYLWYNPDYPLGVLYFYPLASGTVKLDSLKPLIEPSVVGTDVAFPPEYDEAIKWNLAIRMAPEFGRPTPPEVAVLAKESFDLILMKNFASQINESRLDILKVSYGRYNIDWGE